ncbi:MAG: hypothetical protein ACR2KU_03160 [Gammaproteobacteria bacterium]
MQPSGVNPLAHEQILKAWRTQLARVAQTPRLQQRLNVREQELLPRFAQHYQTLSRLPRRVRRDLQRRVRRAHRAWVQGLHPTRLQSLAGVALLMALGATPAQATTFNVAASDEQGLIDAINAANDETTNPGPDTIVLANSTFTLTNGFFDLGGPTGLPTIASTITIAGNGSTIARDSTASEFRILAVDSNGNLTLQQTTISGGRTTSGVPGRNGGGVFNYGGALTLTNSTVSGNSTSSSDSSYGGGVFSFGPLTLTNSTISGNSAVVGRHLLQNKPVRGDHPYQQQHHQRQYRGHPRWWHL